MAEAALLDPPRALRGPLENRDFRRLWLAGIVSRLGTQVGRIGLVLHLMQVSGAVGALALLVVLETLPGVLAAPVAGSWVDRANTARVMIGADLLRSLLLLAILAWPTTWVIYLIAGLHSVLGAFFQPAQRAMVPFLVEADELPRANGWIQSADHASFVLGPVLGAQLMSSWGLAPTLVVDGLSFLASALLLIALVPRARGAAAATTAEDLGASIREGLGYVRRHPLLPRMTALFFVSLAATGLWLPLAPFFLRDHLGAEPAALGWQLGASGLGAILGGLAAPALVARWGAGRTLSLAFAGEGACMAVYAWVGGLGTSTALMVLWGAMVSFIIVPFYSILQRVVEERFLGRVFALVQQSESLALLAAMGAAALLAEHLPSASIFFVGGVAYLLCAAGAALSRGGRALLAIP